MNKKLTTSKQNSNKVTDIDAFTVEAKEKFLLCFQESLNLAASCRAADISFTTYQNWLNRDEKFQTDLEGARKLAIANLYSLGYERASTGAKKPLLSHGRLVRDDKGNIEYVMEYSNSLLVLYLKSHMPEVFGDKPVETNPKQTAGGVENIPDGFLVLNPIWLRSETISMIEEDIASFQDKQKGIVNSASSYSKK